MAIPSFACAPSEPASADAPAPSAAPVAAPTEPALRLYWAGLDACLSDPRDEELRNLFGAQGALESALSEAFPAGLDWALDCLRWPCLLVIDGEPGAPRGQLTVRTSSAEAASALASSLEPALTALQATSAAARVLRPGWKAATTAAGELVFGCEQADFVVALGEPHALEFRPAARDLEPELVPRVTFTLDAARLAALDWPAALGFGTDPAQRLARLEGWPASFEFGGAAQRNGWVQRTQAEARECLPDSTLALLPSAAVQAFVQRGELAALLDVVALAPSAAALGRFVESHRELASTLVASLGTAVGSYSIEAPWNEHGLATVAFAEVVDTARFERALAEWLELLAARPSSLTDRFERKTVTLAGVEAHVLTLGSLPHAFEAALALHGGHVFLAETPRALELALEQARGGGASLLDRPELAGAREAGLCSLAFTDVARLAESFEPVSTFLFALLADRLDALARAPTKPLHEQLADARPTIERIVFERGELVARGTADGSLLALFLSQWVQGSHFAGALFQNLLTPTPPPADDVEHAEADLRALENAVEQYAIENAGRYPDSLLALVIPDENGFTFLKGTEIPRDPWGHEYGYEWDGSHPEGPRVFSLGADGLPGGTDINRDLDSRELPRDSAK